MLIMLINNADIIITLSFYTIGGKGVNIYIYIYNNIYNNYIIHI